MMRGLVLVACAAAACGDLEGFDGERTPLTTVHLQPTGDFEAVRVPGPGGGSLHAALVWGAQWLPEPMCFLPAENAEVQAAIDAGCRDILGFVPDRVGEVIPLASGASTELSLFDLPSADVMIGDVTGRIAYASLFIFDDRNDNGLLELERSTTAGFGFQPDFEPPPPRSDRDLVYGASFVTMTEPDTRVALLEGEFNPLAAFYPRSGCGSPFSGFSIVSAGGFSRATAIAAAAFGRLPPQDPATCREQTTDGITIDIPFRTPASLGDVGCYGRRGDSSVRYREPPQQPLDLTSRVAACAKVPDFGSGEAADVVQYVVSTKSEEPCKGLNHYLLRGCEEDATCEVPDWDITANPPAWWPCPASLP